VRSTSGIGLLLALVGAVLCCVGGCAGGSHDAVVDVADYERADEGESVYRLRVGDVLAISFPADRDLDYTTPVSPVGTVSVPSGGEVVVAGKTIDEARAAIESRMSELLREPRAMLTLDKVGQQPVYVLGEVGKPGPVMAAGPITVTMALAGAGGMEPSGKPSSVMVIRSTGVPEAVAIKVDVGKVLSGGDLSYDLPLQAYDIVYVPKSAIGKVNEFVDLFFHEIAPAQLFYLRGYDILNREPLRSYE